MRIGTSIVLLAIGAILAFAVEDTVDAINLIMVGYILMVVGALGLLITLIMSGFDDRRDRQRRPPPAA